MNIAVDETDAVGHIHVDCTLRALKDLRSIGGEGCAVAALDAKDSTAVQAATIHNNTVAVLEEQHSAGTDAGFFGVAGSKADKTDVAAGTEAQYIGITRNRCKNIFFRVFAGSFDGKPRDTLNDQCRAVVTLLPEPVFSCYAAVTGSGRKVKEASVQNNGPVRWR